MKKYRLLGWIARFIEGIALFLMGVSLILGTIGLLSFVVAIGLNGVLVPSLVVFAFALPYYIVGVLIQLLIDIRYDSWSIRYYLQEKQEQ